MGRKATHGVPRGRDCDDLGHLPRMDGKCDICGAEAGRGATDADQRVGWQFWRWPEEIRRLRRSQLHLLRRLNAMHVRAGIAEGWLVDGGDTALIVVTPPARQTTSDDRP